MEGRAVEQAGASFPGEASSAVPSYETWSCPVCEYEQWQSSGGTCKRCDGVGAVFGVGDVVRVLGSKGETEVTKTEFNTPRSRWEYAVSLGGWYSGDDIRLVRRASGERSGKGKKSGSSEKPSSGGSSSAVGGSGGAGDGGDASGSGAVDSGQPRSGSFDDESASISALPLKEEVKR